MRSIVPKRPFYLAAIAASLSLSLVAACAGDDGAATSPTADTGDGGAPLELPDEFVIGSILSLTGQGSSFGETLERTQDLFEERTTEIAGVPLRFVTCDDGSTPDGAAACVRRLADQDDVDLILGPHLAGSHRGAQPLLARGPLSLTLTPYVDPAADEPIFTVAGRAIDIHATTAEFLVERGWTDVAMIATTDVSGEIGVEEMTTLAAEHDLNLAIERMDVTDEDATAQMSSLLSSNPDAIVVEAVGRPAGVVFGAMRQLRASDIPTFMLLANAASGFLQGAAEVLPSELYVAASNAALPDAIEDPSRSAVVDEWNDAYEEKYGSAPDAVSTLILDLLMLAVETLDAAGNDQDAMVTYIEGLDQHPLYNWTVSYSDGDHRGPETGNFQMVRMTAEGAAAL